MCDKYGADCFRMYEMFLGPLEQSKPWNTNGITGVFGFLKKFWKLFHGDSGTPLSFGEGSGGEASKAELKILHKTIKKITDDIERYSFNTCISTFMICVNELTDLKCNKKEILEPLVVLVSPFAPHIAEELWNKLGHNESVTFASWPKYDAQFVTDDTFAYPVSFNGKTRFNIELPLALNKEEIEKEVLSSEEAKKFLHGNQPKKVIVVPGRIVNVVV
jgi:leucyl-tRNA synthetase